MIFRSKRNISPPPKNKLFNVLITDNEIIGFAKSVEVIATVFPHIVSALE